MINQLNRNKCVSRTQYPPYIRSGKISDLGILGHLPQKGRKHIGEICTIMQNFTPIGGTVAEISVTKKPD